MPESTVVNRDELVKLLLENDKEFQRLHHDHQELETTLGRFNTQRYLTTEDEVERKRVQKLKLLRKDQMEEIIHRAAHTSERGVG